PPGTQPLKPGFQSNHWPPIPPPTTAPVPRTAQPLVSITRPMARKPLRSQLNQIRAWVRQGRTDAWIAHQLDVSASELREFRRRHELSAEDDDSADLDLRDEIEAEIEAEMEA